MREEYKSVLSTLIQADNISCFSRYRYIGKTQISADISVDLYLISLVFFPNSPLGQIYFQELKIIFIVSQVAPSWKSLWYNTLPICTVAFLPCGQCKETCSKVLKSYLDMRDATSCEVRLSCLLCHQNTIHAEQSVCGWGISSLCSLQSLNPLRQSLLRCHCAYKHITVKCLFTQTWLFKFCFFLAITFEPEISGSRSKA